MARWMALGVVGLWLGLLPAAAATIVEQGRSGEEIPVTVVVDLRDGLTLHEVEALEAEYGVRLEPNSVHSGRAMLMQLRLDEGQRPEEWVSRLSADPRVEAVEVEQLYWAAFEPNDPLYRYQWHFQQVGAPAAWDVGNGRGVVVAVIDTGVAYEDYEDRRGKYHRVEDLEGVEFVAGYDFVNDDEHPNDDHAHGTHVTGTIAQATNNGKGVAGLAHGCRIMPLKVLSAHGFGKTADIAEAVRFAADHGAQVINMSLGGPSPSKILREAIHYAHKKGVVVVAAAGNNGSRRVSYPAAFPHTIAVSATRYDEALTWYSNYGKAIDLAAPGGDTRVDQNGDGYPDGVLQNTINLQDPTSEGYLLFQGTSMASPHVAAAAALVMGQGVTNPDKVEELLKATARQKGAGEWNEQYGYGIVDAAAAVSKAAAQEIRASLGIAVLFALVAVLLWGLPGTVSGLGWVVGLLTGSAGLFFPLRGELPGVLAFLGEGVARWPAVFWGVAGYGHPLVLSVLVPLTFVALLYGWRRGRSLLGGLAIGFGAYLLAQAELGHLEVYWIPDWGGDLLDRGWLVLNGLLSVGLGLLVLRPQRGAAWRW